MWRALVVAVGVFWGVAYAAPEESPAQRGPFGDPIEEVKEDIEDKRSEAEKARDERRKKLKESQAGRAARVVVLQWRDSDVDYTNDTLRRNIRGRIARGDAKFYPDVDIYQAGRKEPDQTIRPLDQRAMVPDDAIDRVMGVVSTVEAIPWNALDETEWGIKAHELKDLADEIWFVDRPELREPLFRLYTMIGYSAENSNNPIPPFFEEVAGISVNYYYYLAAAMASREPSLMSKLTDTTLYGNVDHIKRQIESGSFAPMVLDFEVGVWDADKFTSEYQVFFNGIEDQITNKSALYNVPPGIMDIYLKRSDGHAMSARIEAVRLDREEIYGVREQARKRMGLDFIEQLMENPEQCIPNVDGDILNYLSIYQKLHPQADIFVAIPVAGSIHKINLWRWDREQGVLYRINDQTGGFPVRFVALVGTGIGFSGASFGIPEEQLRPPEPTGQGETPQIPNTSDFITLEPAALPVSYELRGHWGRLMVGFGMDFSFNLTGDKWNEVPQSRHRDHVAIRNADGTGVDVLRNRILTDRFGEGEGAYDVPATKQLTWQRGVFVTIGAVMGRDAAYGFGPRIAARTGWYNAPHAVDLTGHLGWAIKPPIKKKRSVDSRVFPVIDTDLYGGVMLPYGDSIHLLTTKLGQDPDGNPQESIGADGVAQWLKMAQGTGGFGCDNGRPGSDVQDTRDNPDSYTPPPKCKFRKIGDPILNFGFSVKVGLTF